MFYRWKGVSGGVFIDTLVQMGYHRLSEVRGQKRDDSSLEKRPPPTGRRSVIFLEPDKEFLPS